MEIPFNQPSDQSDFKDFMGRRTVVKLFYIKSMFKDVCCRNACWNS